MRDGTSRVGVGQQFIAYQLFMSPTSLHRYDRYVLETVSSEAGRDRQQLFRFVQHLPSGLRHAPHRAVARAGVEQT